MVVDYLIFFYYLFYSYFIENWLSKFWAGSLHNVSFILLGPICLYTSMLGEVKDLLLNQFSPQRVVKITKALSALSLGISIRLSVVQ